MSAVSLTRREKRKVMFFSVEQLGFFFTAAAASRCHRDGLHQRPLLEDDASDETPQSGCPVGFRVKGSRSFGVNTT